jgi:hypothetical protein
MYEASSTINRSSVNPLTVSGLLGKASIVDPLENSSFVFNARPSNAFRGSFGRKELARRIIARL